MSTSSSNSSWSDSLSRSLKNLVPTTSTGATNWNQVGLVAALGTSLAALGAVSMAAYWSPFPRGRTSRAKDSPVFPSGVEVPASCTHQFYTPDQFQFVELSWGRVRYSLRGGEKDSKKPVVVLVHGFSIAMDIWKQVADELVEKGFRVLSFDNYGRGYSDALDMTLDDKVYIGQIAELLFALDINTPIDLIGVSMGGAIVSTFAAKYPQKVRNLCLVCPAGLPIVAAPVFASTMKWPVLGPLAFLRAVPKMQAQGAAAQWENKDGDMYKAWGLFARGNVFGNSGFLRTLYRTVTEYPMYDQRHNFALLAKQPHLRYLIIWGDKDGLTPYSNAEVLKGLLPGSQLVTVLDAKHNFLIERPHPIAQSLAAWLNGDNKLPTHVR